MANTQKNNHKSRIKQRKSRRVLGSRAYKNYSQDMLNLASEAVSSKQISSRDAERQFGIPRRTIVNKIKNMHASCVGRPTKLTMEEEKKIVKVLQASSDFGSPLTKVDLKLLVHEYLKKNSRVSIFNNKVPGDAWVQGFLARHADELSVRVTQNISKARAEKGPQEIAEYFENLHITLKDIPATNIVNFDETNLSDDPGSSKCIFRRGVRYPERIANSTKGNISIMFTAIASGQCLPLYVVYKAKNLYTEWITGGPLGARYNCSKSGWFDSAMFEDYFEKIIVPWARDTSGSKVVICDNLSSHISVKVVELCELYNIKFVFIPPRSTHLTQPLDIAFFGPLKKSWRRILYQYKLKNPNQTSLNKKHFPKLLAELTESILMNEEKNIKSGFRAAGIFPWNPQEVLKKIPEMQEQILSYGLDQTLIDFLKETRTPKPMAVKRNKKVNCEPGKAITVHDLNIICPKKVVLKSNSRKKNRNDVAVVPTTPTKNECIETDGVYLNEQTGIFTNIDLSANYDTHENQDLDIQKIDAVNNWSSHNNHLQSISILKSPQSLSNYCIAAINLFLYQSVDELPQLNNGIFTDYFEHKEPIPGTSLNSTKNITPKITILSNVVIKAASQIIDVHYLKDASSTDNTPFIAKCNQDLPKCFQQKSTEIGMENDRKVNKMNTKNKRQMNSKKVREVQRHVSVKRKKKLPISDSSTSSDDSIIKLDDTDNSDYQTIQSYDFSEYLTELENKENVEPAEIPFGLNDIEYSIENPGELREGDWIVARFATKKSLKHFVGKIVSITDKKPTVTFVRKVKQSKCDQGTKFTYPTVDDICTMDHLEDVISILPEPIISRRGQIIFHVNFSNLNIQ